MKKFLSKISFRFVAQFSIFTLVVLLSFLHQHFGIEKAAPVDAYCPFGAVESFFTLIFKGEFLKRIFTSSFILFGIFFIPTLFLGRIFCGYFCPLGALQEWFRFLGKKCGFTKDFELPKKLDKYLRYLKYLLLVVIVYFSFYLGDLVFRNYDPFTSLMHFGSEFEEKIFGYSILILIVVAALFAKSWWCRYFCPLGAFWGIVKKLSFHKIKRNAKTCISCGLCDKVCPTNLNIQKQLDTKDLDCFSCGKCISNCPKNSLSNIIFNHKTSKKVFAGLILIFVVLPLIIAPYTPIWKTKPESNILNIHGDINIANIRGSNTLRYLIETTGVPLSEFQAKLGLPLEIKLDIKLKEYGHKYKLQNKEGSTLETSDFRNVIQKYLENQKNLPVGDCPFGEVDCEFPGECGRYFDLNDDKICDHSQ